MVAGSRAIQTPMHLAAAAGSVCLLTCTRFLITAESTGTAPAAGTLQPCYPVGKHVERDVQVDTGVQQTSFVAGGWTNRADGSRLKYAASCARGSPLSHMGQNHTMHRPGVELPPRSVLISSTPLALPLAPHMVGLKPSPAHELIIFSTTRLLVAHTWCHGFSRPPPTGFISALGQGPEKHVDQIKGQTDIVANNAASF